MRDHKVLRHSSAGHTGFHPHRTGSGADTVVLMPLSHSDWQLRGLFNKEQVVEQLLPGLIGKCLLGLLFSLLPLIALINPRRRQRQAHEGRRRYHDIFEGTGVALCVRLTSRACRAFSNASNCMTALRPNTG